MRKTAREIQAEGQLKRQKVYESILEKYIEHSAFHNLKNSKAIKNYMYEDI